MTAQSPNVDFSKSDASCTPDAGGRSDASDTPDVCDPARVPPPVQQAVTAAARDLRERIGRNLLRLRRDRRVTLKQLSRRTGLGMPLLDHFELGKNDIELRQLMMIAQVLGADWRELLEEREA